MQSLNRKLWELRCHLKIRQRLVSFFYKKQSLLFRKRVIAEYLSANSPSMLHIGCGPHQLDGWLNTDIDAREGVTYLDATQHFPLQDECVDYIFSEHMFEHIPYNSGHFFLCEACRVLKRGGAIRIATPDLDFLVRLYIESKGEFAQKYIKYAVDTFIPDIKVYTRGNVINNYFYNWGHRFIYDFEMLQITLSAAGFSEIVRCEPKTSKDLHLCGLERHGTLLGDEFNEYETIVVEARKL